MTIRQKLGLVFFVVAILMTALVGLFVTGGPIMVKRFSRSLDAMEAFNLVRDLRSSLSRRNSSLSMFLLVGESQTLNDFRDLSRESKAALQNLLLSPSLASTQEVTAINISYQTMEKSNEEIVHLYQQGQKARALTLADQESFPQFEKLMAEVKKLEEYKQREAKENFLSFRRVARRGVIVIILVAGVALGMALLLFTDLYRAVMRPLEVLKEGAREFGEGHWNHRISVPSKNEFDTLAQAFNTMSENVRQLQLQTIHMERMSTVGQLAGGVAHELNNPLTGVLGQAQLLLGKTPPDRPEWQQLKKIEQAALRCKTIVRGLLDFSRPQEGQFQPTNINELLQVTLELCEADMKAGKIHVHKELDLTIPQAQANAPQLEQVFLNIITNALHAMGSGGRLTVQTKLNPLDLVMPDRRRGYPPRRLLGPWIEIVISDTGHGIQQEDLGKVFEPFYTTKDVGKGTGLGLAISMGIIRKHGGEIQVESGGPEKGATFRVFVPASRAREETAKASAASSA